MLVRPAIALMALLASAPAAPAEIIWGANGHPITAYPGIPIADQVELLHDLGMTSYRVNISFADQARHLAPVIEAAKARGIAILPVLTPGDIDLDADTPETLRRKARDFAHALATQFADDIPVWELGNELEVYAIAQPCDVLDDGTIYPCDWGPAGGVGPLEYVGARWDKASAVLRGLSEGVRAADPSVRTAMGTAGWGHLGAFERMAQDGLDWDISVWHLYGEDPEGPFSVLEGYGRPIWVTEFNHPFGSRNGDGLQAIGLRRMMARLEELAPRYAVEAVHVYELLDEPYWAPSFEAVMGLVRLAPTPESWRVGAPKPAYAAAREMIRRRPPYRACDLDAAAERASDAAGLAAYAQCLVLDASPDPAALADWDRAFAEGPAAMRDALAATLASEAFRSRHATNGLDDPAFVALVYRLLLDRNADGHGIGTYAGQLGSGALSREAVARAILGSAEFAARHPRLAFAEAAGAAAAPPPGFERDCDIEADLGADPRARAAYALCLALGRDPEPAELESWSVRAAAGEDVLAALLRSDAFAARHAAADLSEPEYVALIFRVLLDREADGAGLADYARALASGAATRETVALAILRSDEFAARHAATAD